MLMWLSPPLIHRMPFTTLPFSSLLQTAIELITVSYVKKSEVIIDIQKALVYLEGHVL